MPILGQLKALLPDEPTPVRVWRGPFRGARVVLSPRSSMRKMIGLYEHELNPWLESALGRVSRVIDVGANDGYFTFGCAAAFRRRRASGEILAIEAQGRHVEALQAGIERQPAGDIRIDVIHRFAGRTTGGESIALDDLPMPDRTRTLIKIDVEGAEVDVLAGARSWLTASNLFVIEVHRRPFLEQITALFAEQGMALLQVNQRPLPLIGRDLRDTDNWWLVSELG